MGSFLLPAEYRIVNPNCQADIYIRAQDFSCMKIHCDYGGWANSGWSGEWYVVYVAGQADQFR